MTKKFTYTAAYREIHERLCPLESAQNQLLRNQAELEAADSAFAAIQREKFFPAECEQLTRRLQKLFNTHSKLREERRKWEEATGHNDHLSDALLITEDREITWEDVRGLF